MVSQLPAELKLRENTDYSIMCTVDSDVVPREEGVIWIIFN